MFLVYCPERGYSRADYNAPYYQVKHFLLEAGFPSQMVDEETIANPSWKDYNLALDIFAHQPTAMCLEPIPDDQQLSVAQMPPQRLEEGDDLRRPHRALHELEVDVPEADTSDR